MITAGACFLRFAALFSCDRYKLPQSKRKALKLKKLFKNCKNMKPIYKSVILTQAALAVSLSLQANVYSGDTTATQAVQAESLQGLRVQLVSPNVSGARDLIASGECTISGATLNVNINAAGLIQGTHRLVVKAEFGTQTVVLYGLDITVTASFEEGDAQEFEDTVTVVSTIGDGDESGADATVYAKNSDGNAHITKPLSIGDCAATGYGAVASGRAYGEGSSIQANNAGSVASGYTDSGNSIIQATGYGSVASGYTNGDGSDIHAEGAGSVASGFADGEGSSILAEGEGAVASGYTDGEGSSILATGFGSVASGYTDGEGSSIEASNNGAVASGCTDATSGNVEASGMASQAFGIGVQATQDAQMVCGKCNVVDASNAYQFIVGNGTADNARHNAFAVTKNGELALFKADGTPVILTAAVLESLIASV